MRAEVRYKQLNTMRQFSNICQTFTNKIKSYTSDIHFQERKLLLAFSNFSDLNAIYVILHNVAYITLEISADMKKEIFSGIGIRPRRKWLKIILNPKSEDFRFQVLRIGK